MTATAQLARLAQLSSLIRYQILKATTEAGSGHPTSSLSAVELMAGLMFGGFFRYDLARPDHPNNDRLIFSKGHASPLFYALWLAAGQVSPQEMLTYRRFGSPLEGHPTRRFRFTEAATGSLGQGLAIGLGIALNARFLDKLPYRTYVLLGDSEMAEGSQWEAIEAASFRKLDNLVAVLDVNRLGQRGETMHGWDLGAYARRFAAFGWETVEIDGHDYAQVLDAYAHALATKGRPVAIIARTVKGKGVAAVEDKENQHGKTLDAAACARAIAGLGEVDLEVRGDVALPENLEPPHLRRAAAVAPPWYEAGKPVATRVAYGRALTRIYPHYPEIVVLDGEVSNSTMAETFKDAYPERFFELYIAEQNLVGAAQGLSTRGKVPFVSTFAAFLTRAHDQIRMSQYSEANLKIVGSHAGVAIGEDGPSQMALEDLAMFRAMLDSVVLYPADAWATEALVETAARYCGLVYLRTTRGASPLLYGPDDTFPIGGSKVHYAGPRDRATIVGAGVTLHEALAAREELQAEGIPVRVIDLYSIKPIDATTLRRAALETHAIVTVEDHYPEGGLGEAVRTAVGPAAPVVSLAVRRRPCSGKPEELLAYEEISCGFIAARVRNLVAGR
jgi:transketolase